MLEINRNLFSFKIKEIWFAEQPYNIKNCDSIFFKSCKNKVDVDDFTCEEHATLVIDLTKDLDQIWKNMDKSSCRYAVNRAIRDGVKVTINKKQKEFIKIYKSFRKSKGQSNFISRIYNSDLELIKANYGTLFTAKHNDDILGGIYLLEDEETIRWIVGASKRLEDNKTLIGNANKLLIWEAIKYAKDKGLKEFDLGGYSLTAEKDSERYGINKFKKSFDGKLVAKYFYQKDYSKVLKLIRGVHNRL